MFGQTILSPYHGKDMKKRVYGGDGGVEEGVGGLYMKGVKSMRDKIGGEAGGKMWEGVQRESSPKGSNARVYRDHAVHMFIRPTNLQSVLVQSAVIQYSL